MPLTSVPINLHSITVTADTLMCPQVEQSAVDTTSTLISRSVYSACHPYRQA